MVFEFHRLTAGFYHSYFSFVSSTELSESHTQLKYSLYLSSRSTLSLIELSTSAILFMKFWQGIW